MPRKLRVEYPGAMYHVPVSVPTIETCRARAIIVQELTADTSRTCGPAPRNGRIQPRRGHVPRRHPRQSPPTQPASCLPLWTLDRELPVSPRPSTLAPAPPSDAPFEVQRSTFKVRPHPPPRNPLPPPPHQSTNPIIHQSSRTLPASPTFPCQPLSTPVSTPVSTPEAAQSLDKQGFVNVSTPVNP